MSLASLRRPRMALRALDRDGNMTVVLPARRIEELSHIDSEACALWRETCEISAVLRDWAAERYGETPRLCSVLDLALWAQRQDGEIPATLGARLEARWGRYDMLARVRPSASLAPGASFSRLCRYEAL